MANGKKVTEAEVIASIKAGNNTAEKLAQALGMSVSNAFYRLRVLKAKQLDGLYNGKGVSSDITENISTETKAQAVREN